jgi:hypothetical protein
MATTKKKPATKTTVKKPTATRKVTTKKPVKKTKVVAERSFRPSQEKTPFMTFKFTEQSVYWLILSVLVLALGAWVMYLNVKIQNIYDQVEQNTQLHESYITTGELNKKSATDTPAAE